MFENFPNKMLGAGDIDFEMMLKRDGGGKERRMSKENYNKNIYNSLVTTADNQGTNSVH